MLCCAVLCCAVLCYAMLCCAVLCYTVLCCAMLCCTAITNAWSKQGMETKKMLFSISRWREFSVQTKFLQLQDILFPASLIKASASSADKPALVIIHVFILPELFYHHASFSFLPTISNQLQLHQEQSCLVTNEMKMNWVQRILKRVCLLFVCLFVCSFLMRAFVFFFSSFICFWNKSWCVGKAIILASFGFT